MCPFPTSYHTAKGILISLRSNFKTSQQSHFGKMTPFVAKGRCDIQTNQILQTGRGFPGILSPDQIDPMPALPKNRLSYPARLFIRI